LNWSKKAKKAKISFALFQKQKKTEGVKRGQKLRIRPKKAKSRAAEEKRLMNSLFCKTPRRHLIRQVATMPLEISILQIDCTLTKSIKFKTARFKTVRN